MGRPSDAPRLQDRSPDPTFHGEQVLAGLAGELAQAARSGVPVPLLSERFPDLTLADAYRVQQINIQRRAAAGNRSPVTRSG
ncbi:hypothetical protein ABT112_18360 [Streptomyces sp. NPDC002055]|uniref:hypothetical protein n=1 Tax=Streptomyces sp. NPDC002055 TaxID=3154534 RepID=UPI00331757BB